MRGRFASVVLALVLSSCKDPSGSCDGSFKAWTRCLESHDWDAAYELLTPDFKRKMGGAGRLARGMDGLWRGSKSFSFQNVSVAETANGVCTVSGEMSFTIKLRGEHPEDIEGEYFSWLFRKGKDERWYIELPGFEKIGAF